MSVLAAATGRLRTTIEVARTIWTLIQAIFIPRPTTTATTVGLSALLGMLSRWSKKGDMGKQVSVNLSA